MAALRGSLHTRSAGKGAGRSLDAAARLGHEQEKAVPVASGQVRPSVRAGRGTGKRADGPARSPEKRDGAAGNRSVREEQGAGHGPDGRQDERFR